MLKTAASATRREFSLVPCISLWCKICILGQWSWISPWRIYDTNLL